jgi:hypothetical protein
MASKNTELKQEIEDKKQRAFIDALKALEAEHGYQLEPIMHYAAKGIAPQIVVVKRKVE